MRNDVPTCLLWSVLALALTACEATAHGAEQHTPTEGTGERALRDVDWDAEGELVFRELAGYLRVPTVNPPGDERLGAEYLHALLSSAQIDAEIDLLTPPSRANLYARLRGDGSGGGPICLVSHIDVVSAEAERWPADKGPFSGAIVDTRDERGRPTQELWGRGAIDMKSLAIMEFATMRLFRRLGLRLSRDLILLAVADEEVGKLGMQHVVDRRWDELACTHAVNEGGLAIHDVFFPGQTVFAISVGERGLSWLRMSAHGKPGHGSMPLPDSAPNQLVAALALVSARAPKPRANEALYQLIGAVGSEQGGLSGWLMSNRMLVDMFVLDQLNERPLSRVLVTDSVNVTGFGGARQPNVVASDVFAQLDTRLLPGTSATDMLAQLRALTASVPDVSFEVIDSKEAAVSDWDDPLYRALARQAVTVVDPGRRVVVGPLVSPGFTDSILLRGKGVRAYGFLPVAISKQESSTAHGDHERISKTNVTRGLRALAHALADVSVRGN
jgi:acetylornithine deacetylase/succinyl-diaminopimelate desuccinylase-like protein